MYPLCSYFSAVSGCFNVRGHNLCRLEMWPHDSVITIRQLRRFPRLLLTDMDQHSMIYYMSYI